MTNEYIQSRLKDLGFKLKVIGEDEQTGQCPCCFHYSIDFGEDGFCDICPVCFWENGGNEPNHMSLEEAQKNFKNFGAMSKSYLQFIDPEGGKKYKKEHYTK